MNSFGRLFRISILGESHGECVGVLIDGVPSGIRLSAADFKKDLARRNPALKGTTSRKEPDVPRIKSGVFKGLTTGAPLLILFDNTDARSKDYEALKDLMRPGHADFTAAMRFDGFNDYRGGGHFSGRLTTGLVAAGVVAKKILDKVKVNARLVEAGGSKSIQREIDRALKSGDSVGGVIECRMDNVPVGLGEPFFDSVESLLSHVVFAIPGIKGIEFGAGFEAAKMCGSKYNDQVLDRRGRTRTNNSGGINGGITNGNQIIFRVAVRPTASISKTQSALNLRTGGQEKLSIQGRHDACFAVRVPVIIEAVTMITMTDLVMVGRGLKAQGKKKCR